MGDKWHGSSSSKIIDGSKTDMLIKDYPSLSSSSKIIDGSKTLGQQIQ